MAKRRIARKLMARKEGARLQNAIVEAKQVPPVSEGLEYKVSGEGFYMRADNASMALIAARAIQAETGVKTFVSLGNTVLMSGDPEKIPRGRRRGQTS